MIATIYSKSNVEFARLMNVRTIMKKKKKKMDDIDHYAIITSSFFLFYSKYFSFFLLFLSCLFCSFSNIIAKLFFSTDRSNLLRMEREREGSGQCELTWTYSYGDTFYTCIYACINIFVYTHSIYVYIYGGVMVPSISVGSMNGMINVRVGILSIFPPTRFSRETKEPLPWNN